jgi:tetratricopeptide (TPR) repeat protein
VLARHFREAGLGEEAVRHLQSAGEWAQKRGGYREALDLLKTASDLVLGLPESPGRERLELKVLSGLSVTSWAMGLSVMDQGETLHRIRELAEAVQDEEQLFWALGRTFTKYHYLGEQEQGRQILEEIASLVDRSGHPGQRMQLQAWRSFSAIQRGFPRQALSLLDQVESEYDPALYRALLSIWVQEPLPVFRSLRALALAPLGYPDQAARAIQEAYGLLENHPDPACLLYVRLHDVLRGWLCRDLREVAPPAFDPEGEGDPMGSGGWSAISRFTTGLALANGGNPHKAVGEMKGAIEDLDTLGWGAWRPFVNALLAGALQRIGATDEALRLVDQSLNRIEETGERFQESEVHRIRGELLLSLPTPDPSGAETAYRRAIAIAQDQDTKLYELRALVSLARLLRDQGRSKEARKMLRKCYRWFTEGFDYPDLKEAGLLLDELG